jgi:putative flippase GtrA
MKKLRGLIVKYKTFLLYLIAGGMTTLVDFAVFAAVLYVGEGADLANTANIISVLTAVVFAYFINKLMVFRTSCESFFELCREAAAFFASRGLTTVFALAAYPFLFSLLKFPPLPSKIAVTAAVILLNYILSVTVVFRKKN